MVKAWRESDLSRVWRGRVLEKQSRLGPGCFFGIKNSAMCGRHEERKVREPQRMSWKFCWSTPPLPTHPRGSRPSALSESCRHPDDLDYQRRMVLRRASTAETGTCEHKGHLWELQCSHVEVKSQSVYSSVSEGMLMG